MFPLLPLELPPGEPETHAQREIRTFREQARAEARQQRRENLRHLLRALTAWIRRKNTPSASKPARTSGKPVPSSLHKYAKKGPLRQQRPVATHVSAAQILKPQPPQM